MSEYKAVLTQQRKRDRERERLHKGIKPPWWGELKGRGVVSGKVCLLLTAEISDHQSISWSLPYFLRAVLGSLDLCAGSAVFLKKRKCLSASPVNIKEITF